MFRNTETIIEFSLISRLIVCEKVTEFAEFLEILAIFQLIEKTVGLRLIPQLSQLKLINDAKKVFLSGTTVNKKHAMTTTTTFSK